MREDTINQLLEDVRVIISSNRAENFKNGKNFNVFQIQKTASDEVRVCKLIRELLDPNGSHGQDSMFLRKFINTVLKNVEKEFSDYDYQHAKIVCEEKIDDNRRIDIVIKIGKRIIPIEVKIYADDQNKQCYDYYNYVAKFDPETRIYYLTLDGHELSEKSKYNLLDSQYECLSFSEDIIKWLDECIGAEEIEQIYSVREVLIQFRNMIRDLTGKQEGKIEMQIKEKISKSYDNVLAAVEIEKALVCVKIDKMCELFNDINQHMESIGYSPYFKNYDDVVKSYKDAVIKYYNEGKNTWPGLSYIIPVEDDRIKGKIALRFEIESCLYFGICLVNEKNKVGKIKDKYIEEYVKENLTPKETNGVTDTWYWWKYFKDNSVNYRKCNPEYFKLYDNEVYTEYLETIYSFIDSINVLIKTNLEKTK